MSGEIPTPSPLPPNPITDLKKTTDTTPLVSFSVNNPVPAFKKWFRKFIANESVTIKIPALTAVALLAFGIGGASGLATGLRAQIANRVPIVNTIFPTPVPTATPNPWHSETLFGTLSKQSSGTYVLIEENGTVIKLEVTANVNMEKLIGKKILAEGLFNEEEKTMKVTEASDLLLFNNTAPVPTTSPAPVLQSNQDPTVSFEPHL